jgi:hypothetical protein
MSFQASTTTFFAASDLVVVGTNPEMADISNPRGDVFGEAWYVVAENEQGDRCTLACDNKLHAERLADALNVRASRGWLPVRFGDWQPARPAYGSDAYIQYGQADDVALERWEQ